MKIFHWLFGSFFRTIGRTIALLLMGSLLYYILSANGIGISDLFFDKVNASILTENVEYYNTSYISTGQSSGGWSNTDGMFVQTIYTNDNEQIKTLSISGVDTTQADYVQLTFSVSQPTDVTHTDTLEGRRCLTWTCNQYCASGACQGMCEKYQCTQYGTWTEGGITNVQDTSITPLNFIITANYSGGWSTCQIEGNSIMCPTLRRQLNSIDFHINFKDTLNTYTTQLMVHRSLTMYQFTTNKIIENQNQNTQDIINQQQNSTQQMLDDNTTQAQDDAEGFFSSFSTPDVGGLSAIITAPLNTIRSLLTSTCTNLVLPLPFVNENLTLPCMNDIYTQHFGLFFTLYQTIILAIISYRCIRSVFFDIKGFSNPDDDRIEVMDL